MRGVLRGVPGKLAVAAGGTLLAVAGWAALRQPEPERVAAPQVRTTTAPVTRGDVATRVQVAGVLGFDGAYTVVNQLPGGVVTALPAPGTAVVRGADLYAVAGVPATLLYGTVPAYRELAAGMSDGVDVLQLEQNLVALGMDPGHGITVDRHFSDATATAVRRWQAARGLPVAQRTGRLELGQVAFLPGAVRIGAALVQVGASAGPGEPVLSATTTARVVRVPLTAGRQSAVHAGDPVTVTVPGLSTPVPGTVREVGTVATAQEQGPATVPMVVTVTMPAGAPALDQSPVQVSIIGTQRRNVLCLPVTALLAGAGGGYQVAVVDGSGRRLVTVTTGLFDENAGLVEITGGGVTEGERVEVPVS
ncbi:peptidoglycan-binding protein [Dactylosporangium aurantiacum]|uniref:Peptidoglycan-binding protein n=1 Tax=Dactylosporangium aurantiacum TaxID=35754 RepID=A0A9Q9MFL4_9ACTN|nr:peptidoglycan-binding protein [Dactylosporangium aurantiacum]MDG6110471.1 peptidoglycan-binding protein [Dactylosporangium aurantiacum]UWZ50741.1 peptidoglycan-binding protein [Dactylosporangium aurantiacum]